jgi:hypothetical protein
LLWEGQEKQKIFPLNIKGVEGRFITEVITKKPGEALFRESLLALIFPEFREGAFGN